MTASKGEVDFNAFPLTAIDRQILAMTDEEYHLTEWDELKEIICITCSTICTCHKDVSL